MTQLTIDIATVLGFILVVLLSAISYFGKRSLENIDATLRNLVDRVSSQNGRIGKLESWTEIHGKEDLYWQQSIKTDLDELLRRK